MYAVVGGEHGAGPRSLPFFSQLNFKIAAERLESAGFRVFASGGNTAELIARRGTR